MPEKSCFTLKRIINHMKISSKDHYDALFFNLKHKIVKTKSSSKIGENYNIEIKIQKY